MLQEFNVGKVGVPASAFDFDARDNLCGDTLEPSEEVRFDDSWPQRGPCARWPRRR